MRPSTAPWIVLPLVVGLCSGAAAAARSAGSAPRSRAPDHALIARADRAYVDAWLTNDPDRVMATLTDDAVILPFGIPFIEGAAAIRKFWWPPDSPPATITAFTAVQHEVGGDGGIGFARGSFTLTFEYDGSTTTTRGDYLSILRRQPDGSWRISHRAWNDLNR